MKKAVIYIHGKRGNAAESAHFEPLFPDCDVIGFDYKAEMPWDSKAELAQYFDEICRKYDSVSVIGNSIGCYYTMNAQIDDKIELAYFISPVADMEKFILGMMAGANVTEDELCEKKEIKTANGAVLSWEYLSYVRCNPIRWNAPAHILYGEYDNLTDIDTITSLAEKIGASLEVMKGGEHWFHTEEQMEYIDKWIRSF